MRRAGREGLSASQRNGSRLPGRGAGFLAFAAGDCSLGLLRCSAACFFILLHARDLDSGDLVQHCRWQGMKSLCLAHRDRRAASMYATLRFLTGPSTQGELLLLLLCSSPSVFALPVKTQILTSVIGHRLATTFCLDSPHQARLGNSWPGAI